MRIRGAVRSSASGTFRACASRTPAAPSMLRRRGDSLALAPERVAPGDETVRGVFSHRPPPSVPGRPRVRGAPSPPCLRRPFRCAHVARSVWLPASRDHAIAVREPPVREDGARDLAQAQRRVLRAAGRRLIWFGRGSHARLLSLEADDRPELMDEFDRILARERRGVHRRAPPPLRGRLARAKVQPRLQGGMARSDSDRLVDLKPFFMQKEHRKAAGRRQRNGADQIRGRGENWLVDGEGAPGVARDGSPEHQAWSGIWPNSYLGQKVP